MEINWYGQTCFRLKDRKVTVWTDPFASLAENQLNTLKAEIVTVSRADLLPPGRNGEQPYTIIDKPGEYEVANIFVTGVYLPPTKQQSSNKDYVFIIYLDDLAVCHLGRIPYVPTQSQIETLGSIDVLIVPIDGQATLSVTQAAELISLIEPQIVIPMYEQSQPQDGSSETINRFLKEMGLSSAETIGTLRLSKSQLPEETQVVLLEQKV